MNEPQRTVLQTQMRNIAKDIIMSEEILSALYEKKIFEPHMIEHIRAEKTKTEQTYKMLELLPKRGPEAFDNFIEIIQEDYPWLATSLQSRCRSAMDRYTARTENNISTSPTKKIPSDQTDGKKIELESNNGGDVKKKVHTFVHKYFGQSKRLSEKDKKLIVNWMTNQITDERMRLQSVSTIESIPCETELTDYLKLSKVKDELFKLHLKLEPYISHSDNEHNENSDISSYLPDDMSFKLLSEEIDQVCLNLTKIQDEIDSSLDQFDACVRDNGVKVLVESLILKYNKQSEELDKEGKRNTELINDLSDYSEQIHKLETERAKMRYQIDLMHKDLSHIRHERFRIQEYNKNLDRLNKEKDETINKLNMKISELLPSKPKKDAGMPIKSETSRSPTRKSRQNIRHSLNFNTPLFSKRSSQYYNTPGSRPPSQKKNT